jgi:hypothetical protein
MGRGRFLICQMTLLWDKTIFSQLMRTPLDHVTRRYIIWFKFSYFLITGRSSRPSLPYWLEKVANSTPTFWTIDH